MEKIFKSFLQLKSSGLIQSAVAVSLVNTVATIGSGFQNAAYTRNVLFRSDSNLFCAFVHVAQISLAPGLKRHSCHGKSRS